LMLGPSPPPPKGFPAAAADARDTNNQKIRGTERALNGKRSASKDLPNQTTRLDPSVQRNNSSDNTHEKEVS